MAAQTIPTDFAIIDDDDVPSNFDTIANPVRLKRIRTGGKTTHTKAGKTLMQAIRAGDDRDTVRSLQATYVSRYVNFRPISQFFYQLLWPVLCIVGQKEI